MYEFKTTTKFKKDFKLCEKRNYDFNLFDKVYDLLEAFGELPEIYNPHLLKGNYKEHWECHIKPDWLLIWLQDDESKIIKLVRTGTHSDLFK
ncbi:type II toxin-antitoxin system YafQ family toxin [Flavobacterium sp. ZT3R18]|uniref:type II toxin-antitoxin system YafQ family toxin n=1 Tax=Flavobacterium sp. ZT3R18 TaxID=2594429 RepID=UPI00117A1D67|nr:type II toxin-antitoxin system YafQ family toxin [Flavobacterium sp. ZT3R18]TRX36920.1 type II toxin-antitoxin system YafQ family toxin [Flavobacterium sp. ZT3R18]